MTEDGETIELDSNAAELKRLETGNIFEDLKEENIRAARGSIAIRQGDYLRDTRKLVDSLINKTKNIEIKIGQPLIREGGMFSAAYVTFKVTTSPLGWETRRRESEFDTLRKILVKTFPQIMVPPLPTQMARKISQRAIAKR